MRKEMEKKTEEEKKDFLEMTKRLKEATDAANKREFTRLADWAEEMEDDAMGIPEISITPAEAVDVAAQVATAVEQARREQRAQVEAELIKLLRAKDEEIQKLEQKLKAKEIPVPMFRKAPAPKRGMAESKHAPKASEPSQPEPVVVEDKEDEKMEEAPVQMEAEEMDENSPETRGDSPVSEADDLEFVAAERKPMIRMSVTPTAPRHMRENGPPPPVPPRPTQTQRRAPQVQILKRLSGTKDEKKKEEEPVSPPAPKTTWAAKAAARPAEAKFALVGKKGKTVKPKDRTEEQQQSPLSRHKGSIPVDQRTIVFTRRGNAGEVTMAQKARITTAINKALFAAAPTNTHVRVEFVRCSPKGTITGMVKGSAS